MNIVEFQNIVSTAVFAAESVSEYLMQANLVLTFCIVIVLAIRFPIRKYPGNVVCRSWGIVIFGLLYFTVRPLQFPVSRLRAFFTEYLCREDGREAFGNSAGPQMMGEDLENTDGLSGDSLFPGSPEMTDMDGFSRNAAFFQDLTNAAGDNTQDVRFTIIFSAVWFAGILILIFRHLYLHLGMRRRTRFAVKFRDNIFELDGYTAPFVYGIFRAKIYVPYGLKEEELAFIVNHEQCHIRRKDHLLLPAARLMAVVFWINPLAWIAYRKFRLDIEMRCDECATERLDIAGKRAYALLLLDMALSGKAMDAVGFSSKGSVLKRRIENIMERKKRKLALPVCIIALCVLLVAVSISFASESGSASESSEEKGSSVNAEKVIEQADVDQQLARLGLQDQKINLVILDESGQILAQQGDINKDIIPGSAARPVIAADILSNGDITFDSVVQGNSIVCRDSQGMESVYPNWRKESGKMTFEQALAEWSQVGLISAALNTDLQKLERALTDQGFSGFDAASEDSIASCINGQGIKISVYDLADSYRSVFTKSENSQLRSLMKQSLQNQCGEYDVDLNVAGSYGTGSELLSGDPADPETPVTMSVTPTYVGDGYINDQRVVIALSRCSENRGDETMTGRDLFHIANSVLTAVEKQE